MAQISLRSFCHAHLQVDGISVDIDFGRIDVREHVTIVIIEVGNRIIVLIESLFQQLLVIYITLLHTQNAIQVEGIVYGITRPCDISQIISLAFSHLDVYIYMLVIKVAHAVFQNLCIAITVLVVFLDQFLLIFLPTLRCKLLGFEESGKLTSLMSLGKGTLGEESTLDLPVAQLLVTVDGNLVYLDLFLLVYYHIKDYLSLVCHVITLVNLDVGVLETLVVEVFLGKNLGTVQHVRSNLRTLHHTEFLLHVFTFALLQTDVIDV